MTNAAAFDALAAFRDRLGRFASGAAARAARQAVAVAALDLVRAGFVTKTAPGGAPWRPRKRDAPGSLLVRTGALRDGWRAVATALGVAFHNAVPYAGYHQRGAPRLPARPMVPDRVPARWLPALDRAARDALAALLR